MATFLPGDLPENLKSIQPYLDMATEYESTDPCISYWCRLYALKQGFTLNRVEEDLSFLLVLMKVLGENRQEWKSEIEVNNIPFARAHLEGELQKVLNWSETTFPWALSIVTKASETLLDVCSIFGEPIEDQAEKKKYTDTHGENLHGEFQSKTLESTSNKSNIQYQNVDELSENLCGISRELMNDEKKENGSLSTSFAKNDGENRKSRKFTEENELQNHIASQKKPDGLPSLEIVRDKMGRNKMIAGELLGVQQQPQPRPSGATTYFRDRLSHPTSPISNTKPQQVPVAPPPTAQPRPSSVASWRARSSNLRIVDPNTNRDVLTGEEVPLRHPRLD